MLPITLTGNDTDLKRDEIEKYFLDSYKLFESLFEIFIDDKIFYKKSEPTRHPMIFYFGHTAAFFINKLFLAKIIQNRINPDFESIFAIGVDEMNWDDLDNSKYNWPDLNDVREYRDKVKKLILKLIKTLPLTLPIKQNDPMWIILMGIEHERIHIETSSVLHRQMPFKYIKDTNKLPICQFDNKLIKNKMETIQRTDIRLGKEKDHHLYGWDNEYGKLLSTVDQFEVSKYLVSNGEFLEFINDNGYTKKEYWDEEGIVFLKNRKALYPTFWIKQINGDFKLRTITKEIPLPLSWPVEVNALEAFAFCRWKSKKENINYTLPSEEQFYAIYKYAQLQDVPLLDDSKANINLKYYYSPCPVDQFKLNGIFDVIGNVWQWTRTPIYGFEGFEVHPVYDDFSTPTFDNKHNLIKGGSFISTGNEIMKHSRYAFRRHFYQHAGFRYIKGDQTIDIKSFDKQDEFIKQELKKYKEDKYSNKIFEFITTNTKNKKIESVFEIGCSMGALSQKLASNYKNIIAVDTTARIIEEAIKLKEKKLDNLEFRQADPCNLKPHFKNFDMIIINNILSRIHSNEVLLLNIQKRLTLNGIIITVTNGNDDISYFKNNYTLIKQSVIGNLKVDLWQ